MKDQTPPLLAWLERRLAWLEVNHRGFLTGCMATNAVWLIIRLLDPC